VIKVDNWGKRRLAYEVAKERKGIYLYWQYLAQPGVVEETERNLRMLDSVIRYLTVKIDEDVDTGARPSEIDDASYEKAAQTAADEEDLFLSRGGDDSSNDDDNDIYGDDDGDVIPGSKKPVAAEPEAEAEKPAAPSEEKE
jgi:small subunit ribosomal protein S6